MKKSYYEGEMYVDITTGQYYRTKDKCEICGIRHSLQVHHYLPQTKCIKNLKAKKTQEWTSEFIQKNQKLFTVCTDCHNDTHSYNTERFKAKYGRNLQEYIYKNRYL